MQDADHYSQLRDVLDKHPSGCPEGPGIIEILQTLFSPEEARVAASMVFVPRPVDWIAPRAGLEPVEVAPMLAGLADRGLTYSRTKDGVCGYALLPVMPGLFEFPFMKGERTELQEKLAALWKEYLPVLSRGFGSPGMSMSRIIPIQEQVESVPGILTFEMIDSLIDSAKSIGIAHCACRESEQNCDAPREACMVFDETCDYLVERGIARYLTHEEMKEKLREFDRAGLVHQVNNSMDKTSFICNCCRCCCMLLRSASAFGNTFVYASSGFVPEVDTGECDACGICAEERCPVGAMAVTDGTAVVEEALCIGCGLCVTGCPNDALVLARREAAAQPAQTTRDMGVVILQEKGKLADFVEMHSK